MVQIVPAVIGCELSSTAQLGISPTANSCTPPCDLATEMLPMLRALLMERNRFCWGASEPTAVVAKFAGAMTDETFRITWLQASATYRFPAASMAKPMGLFNCALMAGPLSP